MRSRTVTRMFLPGAVAIVLAACAAQKTQPPGASKRAPAPESRHAPVPPSPPSVHVLDARAPEQDKAHVKQALAKDARTALAPADVGYYLDVLQGRLQENVNPGVIISREGQSLVLDFSRRVDFATDSAAIDSAVREQLAELAKILAEYRTTLILVRVGAESRDGPAQALARQRALAIAHVLSNSGVTAKRIVAMVSDATARGEAGVEIQLEPIVGAAGTNH